MRMTSKSPSEWLRLLCSDWALGHEDLVASSDMKFLGYKSYLKGRLSSQLLCRLSIPELPNENDAHSQHAHQHQHQHANTSKHVDFWGVLGIQDEFDKAYIVSQIERFCALYSIRAVIVDDDLQGQAQGQGMEGTSTSTTAESEVPMGMVMGMGMQQAQPHGHGHLPNYINHGPRYNNNSNTNNNGNIHPDRRELRHKEREAAHIRKASDRAAREISREERRQKKLKIRHNREQVIRHQKEAALARAAELVRSNRVPIEITRGAAAAQAAANAAVAMMDSVRSKEEDVHNNNAMMKKKQRSDIVVSTASDLDRIVTHAKNLWTKYNAIAKQHNQKVNWSTVSKELGIHVKVREKYARMHSRALQRGFDFKLCGKYKYVNVVCYTVEQYHWICFVSFSPFCTIFYFHSLIPYFLTDFLQNKYINKGHFKIKEHPHIFLDPIVPQQKVKMNVQQQHPKLESQEQTQPQHHVVAVYNKDISVPVTHQVSHQHQHHNQHQVSHQHHHNHISDDQVAAAVDAAIKTVPVAPDVGNCYDNAAATVDTVMNTNGSTTVGLSVADAAQAALAVAPEHVNDGDQIEV